MDSPMEVICSKYNGDTLCEILIRLDPSSIFNCMIVSKQWLSAITDPVFRRKYLNRWRNSNSKVVGMLLYDHIGMKSRRRPGLQLLPTSNLGVKLNATKPMLGGGIAFFISKSPKGGLLLFRGIDPKRFFVCKPISGGPPVELPPPPAHYKSCMANIQSDDDDGEVFKVVLACNCDDTRVRIQTYCSRSGKWGEQSSLTCCTPFRVSPSSASMAKGSVVYWAALVNNKVRCLVAWNMDEGSRRISLIPEPVRKNNGGFSVSYGVSPQP